MKATETNLLDWQKRYGTEDNCAKALAQQRWPEGFRCPECGHDHGYTIATRHSNECSQCHHQTSLTAGTLFHSTNLPLTKCFWAIYLMASDKGGISAVRLSRQIGVSWITASRMLRKIRMAMGHRDSVYRLHDLIEMDDAFVGGRRSGKRGRGAEGKSPVWVVVENRDKRAGFIALQQVPAVTKKAVAKFVQGHLSLNQSVRSDAFASLTEIGKTQQHTARVTPPDMAGEWLPWVQLRLAISRRFCWVLIMAYQLSICRSISMSSVIDSIDAHGRQSCRYAYSTPV